LTLAALLLASAPAASPEPCQVIHGRAHFYSADGQLRIWHIGTHHEFEPDASSDPKVMRWLEEGVPDAEKKNYASPASNVMLYGDFAICPTEPFREGAVQTAKVLSVWHRHYVRLN
jgi:hypothetical protein